MLTLATVTYSTCWFFVLRRRHTQLAPLARNLPSKPTQYDPFKSMVPPMHLVCV